MLDLSLICDVHQERPGIPQSGPKVLASIGDELKVTFACVGMLDRPPSNAELAQLWYGLPACSFPLSFLGGRMRP